MMSDKEESSVTASTCVQATTGTVAPSLTSTGTVLNHCDILGNSHNTSTSSSIPTAKRQNIDSVLELCASSENKPLSYFPKRQRTKSGSEQMESNADSKCSEKQTFVNGVGKKASMNTPATPQSVNTQNPLCERNIRLDNDHSNALNQNTCYDINSARLSAPDSVLIKTVHCENTYETHKILSPTNNSPSNLLNTNTSSTADLIPCSNNMMNKTSHALVNSQHTINNNDRVPSIDTFTTKTTDTTDTDINNIDNNNTRADIQNQTSTTATSCIDRPTNSPLAESASLTSAISSLDSRHPQRSPSSSTLDYVARLPSQQVLAGFEDMSGATPPYTSTQHTPLHHCSGDEDDDNYLDDSTDGEEEGDEGADAATNNDEDESCGEDDGSVVSTVGSTCSLRSVASEALAAICRNEQGQTTNQDGSLLYNISPSTLPLPAFSPSLFSHVPPAIRFCQHNEVCRPLPECVAKLLKWRYTPITPLIIRKTVANSGFKMTKRTILWSGTWGKHMKSTCFKTIRSYQKVNHFPGTFQIGRKDKLWNNFLRLQLKFGKEEFGFMPKTFILPAELNALKTAFDKEGVKKKWIVKPPASARGTGIQVVDKWSQLDTTTPLVVQRYVSRPYLINNTKFDLRIYVLVTSFHPLRIYLYQDGLVRFASVEYRNESTTLSDRFMHLTNYSVNKTNSSYTHNTEAGQCQGHRWTLCTLWGYLKAQGVDTGALWSRIADMVIKTILSGEHDIIIRARKNLRSKYSSYELFGFDVLLDEKLRPWLLEVNISPSLHSACSLDYMVKGPLMAHILTMASFHVPDHRSLTPQIQTEVLSESGLQGRVSRLTLDHRLYTRLLTDVETVKHSRINSLPRQQYLVAALDCLTPDDVRHLVLGEDEIQRAGKFTCIFPTAETHQYFGFLEKPRYYNRLWDAWETAYGSCREKGIERLEQLCSEKFHLVVPPKFKMPKVVGAPPPKPPQKEDSISVTTSCSASVETATTTITSRTLSATSTPQAPASGTTQDTTATGSITTTTTTSSSTAAPLATTTVADGHSSESLVVEANASGAASAGDLPAQAETSPTATTITQENGTAKSASNMTSDEVDDACMDGAADGNGVLSSTNKRSMSINKVNHKRSRLMSRRARPQFKVHPTKPAEGNSLLLAGLVAGGRGGTTITERFDGDDVTQDGDSDDGNWDEGEMVQSGKVVDMDEEEGVKGSCTNNGGSNIDSSSTAADAPAGTDLMESCDAGVNSASVNSNGNASESSAVVACNDGFSDSGRCLSASSGDVLVNGAATNAIINRTSSSGVQEDSVQSVIKDCTVDSVAASS